ncbi:lysylphosphatidylglycerol synthase transmembrane domain-containing protein [Paractinoplanes durhamensis]|uniref:Flippase-like domain-containing protein n=1 Tax=Paractinoplanes durhamensis TaxID=113563 RepID=A0ABQ3ZEF0_9ACTN|nr:YbhN family protein [Actinoplanes durhamensis]GIE07919.1 hypothetical protein Adu01nite_92690 [Actinoplanes durhamensis]
MELGVAGGRRTGFALREFVVAASRRWWVRGLAALVAGVVVVVTLRGRAPEPGEILAALRATDARWFAVAVLLQQLSQAAFGRQQRVMLAAFGVRMSRPVALAVAYARSAISLAFPAGSAMSAAYAMGQYRRRGATAAAAATTMVLSGAASVGGLLLAYAAVAGSMVGLRQPALAVVVLLCLVAVVPVVVGAVRARVHHESRIAARLPAAVGRVLREVRTVRPRELGVTVAFAVLNWLLDLACLAAAARGSGLSLSVAQLATVYLAVQVVRQIPITPGGFGLIEASLLAGLVAAGAPHAAAAAAVLVYRLASCWLVLPIGLASHLVLRLGGRHPVASVT